MDVLGNSALESPFGRRQNAMLLDQLGLNEREAEGLVEGFYEEISLALANGESVQLAGFGRFEKDTFTPSVGLMRAVK